MNNKKAYYKVMIWHQIVKIVAIISLTFIGVVGIYIINNANSSTQVKDG